MARFLGRDDDFRVLNYSTSGKTRDKTPERLSNTNNPFTFGSAEGLTQLLVSLMSVSDGANSIFADKAQTLITGIMYALVDLRDKGLIKLSTRVLRETLTLEKCVELAMRPELDEESRASIQAALGSTSWIAGRELKDQPPSFAEQFGYAQSYFGKALSSLTDTYNHIYGAEDGEVDFSDAIMQRRILVVLLPSLEKAPPNSPASAKSAFRLFATPVQWDSARTLKETRRMFLKPCPRIPWASGRTSALWMNTPPSSRRALKSC